MSRPQMRKIPQRVEEAINTSGKEFANHNTISKELAIDCYFACPYHSWERGANENTNELIRQYFPKGSSFQNIANQDNMGVQNILNN